MPIPSWQESKMPAYLVPAAKLLGFQVPGIWQYGVILYAREGIWGIWSPFPRLGGTPKIIKNHDFWLRAATQPKCHESILFATFALCWHGTKNIEKSTFWHPKIDILGVSVHILASWSGTMPIPSCQDAKMPAFLVVPRYLASRYLVSGSME